MNKTLSELPIGRSVYKLVDAEAHKEINELITTGTHYMKFKNGTVINWGIVSKQIAGNSSDSINIEFPSKHKTNPSVVISVIAHVPDVLSISTENGNVNGVTVNVKNTYSGALNCNVHYISIG